MSQNQKNMFFKMEHIQNIIYHNGIRRAISERNYGI